MTNKIHVKVICLLGALLLYSCKNEKVERSYLSEAERPVFDSLYNIKFDKIRKETDSICASTRDSIFAITVDSMFNIRMQEINDLVNEQN